MTRMLTLVIAGIAIATSAACVMTLDPELPQRIKEAVDWLIKTGYNSDQILKIMHFYLDF